MKKIFAVLILLSILLLPAFSVANRIVISDFIVHSNNTNYEFMGKGIAEMIAVELRKSPGVTLIEREKRIELLEEMEISLSDMADQDEQMKIGKLLAASYMLFGELIDLSGTFLISLRMTDVESGKLIWSEKLTEKLSNYDYISGFFTESILNHFNIKAVESTIAKKEEKEEKAEEVIIAFSKAIDHYDKKDTEKAKQELSKARKLDPGSEAVKIYLSKLTMNMSKFRVESVMYASYQNPAYLALLKKDRLLLLMTGAMPSFLPDANTFERYGTTISAEEGSGTVKTGYSLPITDHFAIGAEAFTSTQGAIMTDIYGSTGDNDLWVSPSFFGGIISSGIRFSENIASGLSFGFYRHNEPAENLDGLFCCSGEAGFLIKNSSSSMVFDTRAIYTTEKYPVPANDTNWKEELFTFYQLPITWENTLTLSPKKNLFFVLKEITYLFLDNSNLTIDLIPAAEVWLSDLLSVRVGLDGKYMRLADSSYWALGGIVGVSLQFKKLFIDINSEYRSKPYYLVPDERYSEILLSISIGIDGLLH